MFKYLALGHSVFAYPDKRAGDQMYGAGVWAALGLLCIPALCGACTDLAFGMQGYVWQSVNCMFTACYSLYLRGRHGQSDNHDGQHNQALRNVNLNEWCTATMRCPCLSFWGTCTGPVKELACLASLL